MKKKNTNEKISILIKRKITNNQDKKQVEKKEILISKNSNEIINSKTSLMPMSVNDVNQIKENLNDMTIYITQLLDLSPFTKIFFLKEENYSDGVFAVRDRKTIIEKNII